MTISINYNRSALLCQNSLARSTNSLNLALQRMSTGLRINSSKDDAAGMAISTDLTVKTGSLSVANRNTEDGIAYLQTATGTLNLIAHNLSRMRDLAEQSANGTYGDQERQAMQAEVNALADELLRVKNSTEYNGKKIFGKHEEPTTSTTQAVGYKQIKPKSDAELDAEYGAGNYTLVTNAQELQDSLNTLSGVTVLAEDIDLKEFDWTAVGTENTSYKGTFDGNGYTIRNLTINKPDDDYQGLFGATSEATIKNVGLENVDVTGDEYTGGLVGFNGNDSKVINSYSTGTVEGKKYTGGLVGLNGKYSSGTKAYIYNSYSGCTVSGNDAVGCLVGDNDSTIINSYAIGAVNGKSRVGGLTGVNFTNSTITNCYSTGSVTGNKTTGGLVGAGSGTVTDSYWDIQTSGQSTSAAGEGKTTAEMKETNTYSSWSKDDWYLVEGRYPELQWNSAQRVNLQVGITSSSESVINVETGLNINNFGVDIMSDTAARNALDQIDNMIATVTEENTRLGATINRLTSVLDVNTTLKTNLTAANSLIKDADIAAESANYIKSQILQQATASLLATANQAPNIALNLI